MIKDYKLLIVGALLLALIVLVLICAWLWSHNRKNINPLPVVADTSANEMPTEDGEPIHNATVHIKADTALERVIDDLIVRFESRYPNIQVTVDYTNKGALFTVEANDAKEKGNLVDTDIIMTDAKLANAQIQRLQETINQAQDERNQYLQSQNPAPTTPEASEETEASADTEISQAEKTQADSTDADTQEQTSTTTDKNNSEARKLSAFSYALKEKQSEQMLQGIVLTNNPAAVSFRNYVLSSAGQDILGRYNYGHIDGYQKSIDELFNPTVAENKEPTVDVADALKDGN